MDQVGADGMAPVERPFVLIEEVIFTLEEDQAVGVVYPALWCREMILWAKEIGSCFYHVQPICLQQESSLTWRLYPKPTHVCRSSIRK